MSISRTLVAFALAVVPAAVLAAGPTQAGDEPFAFRPTADKDSVWTIVAATVPSGQVSPNQAMVAVLRQNPGAFVHGNLHVLRRGVVLTIPTLAQMRAENRARADEVVRDHLRLLGEGSRELAPLYALTGGDAARPAAPAASKPVPAPLPASAPVVPGPAAKTVAPASVPAGSSAPAPSKVPAAASAVPPKVAAAPASAPASVDAPVVAVQPAAERPIEPAPGFGSYLPYAAGVLLLGGALWAWRSRVASPRSEAEDLGAHEGAGTGPRLVNVSSAAVDTARSLDAMKPVVELVRRDGELPPGAPSQDIDLAADATLRLELARGYIELRRHDEAYTLLKFVVQHGTAAQRHDAEILLRGSE